MKRRLDQKLSAIHANPHRCKEFIIADAEDTDVGFGLAVTCLEPNACLHGFKPKEGHYKTLEDYLREQRLPIRCEMMMRAHKAVILQVCP